VHAGPPLDRRSGRWDVVSVARNVGRVIERKRQNYSLGNGAPIPVRAWSPVTRRYHRLRCEWASGAQILCNGGSAHVNFHFVR
jgi:hypothetical protein